MRRKLLLVAIMALAGIIGLPAQGYAVKGIGVTPGLQEVELREGEAETRFGVTVSNSTKAAVNFRLSTVDFGALDESGGVAFLGRTGQDTYAYSLSRWMRLEKTEISVEPGKTETVTVMIANEDSLSPGGHYGAVLVTTREQGGVEGDSVTMLPSASTLVLLKKYGGETYNLKLDQIEANKTFLNLPKSASLRYENKGNIHVVPRGTITLTGPFGSQLASGVINEASSFVLPDTFREINIPLSYTSQPWLPGRYTLTTTWRYDGTDITQSREVHYWYLGKIGVGLGALTSLVIVLYLYILYRRRPITRN